MDDEVSHIIVTFLLIVVVSGNSASVVFVLGFPDVLLDVGDEVVVCDVRWDPRQPALVRQHRRSWNINCFAHNSVQLVVLVVVGPALVVRYVAKRLYLDHLLAVALVHPYAVNFTPPDLAMFAKLYIMQTREDDVVELKAVVIQGIVSLGHRFFGE